MASVITSTANPLIKRIRALEQRKRRDAEGAFFVEGLRPVWLALESDWAIETIVMAPQLLKSAPARRMIREREHAGLAVVETTAPVFESIADREHPSGLGALVRSQSHDLAELAVAPSSLLVALAEVGNPGNLGTIIRTVDAVGGSGVILIGAGTDPYHATAVKASMGTLFRVPLARAASLPALLRWARERDIQLVTTSALAPTVFWDASYRRPLLLLFGSEGEGLSEAYVDQGDLAVRIPMSGSADSLNLAVSAGVLLYELTRQARTV